MCDSKYSNCFVCQIAVDASLKVHQIGNNFVICQSCRKLYYTLWHEIFDFLLPNVYEHLNEHSLSHLNQMTNQELSSMYPSLVSNLEIKIIASLVYKILNTNQFTDHCLNKVKFEQIDSYKTCIIKASEYAIQARTDTLKRKAQIIQIDHKLNIKCEFCRFKFIMFKIKEIPKMRIKFPVIGNYKPNLIIFLKALEVASKPKFKKRRKKSKQLDSEQKYIIINSHTLNNLYSKKEEFVEELIEINKLEKQKQLTELQLNSSVTQVKSKVQNLQVEITGCG